MRSMIRIVCFSMIFAPVLHVGGHVVRVVLVPFARSGQGLCLVPPFARFSWSWDIGACISRSTARLAIGCQSIWAVFIFAKFSKVGFLAVWAFLHIHNNMFYHTRIANAIGVTTPPHT